MPDAPVTNYQSFQDTDHEPEPEPVSWKRFFVIEAGITNGVHCDAVKKLKRAGQTEVLNLSECDYVVIFCPISSRVGTNIDEALDRAPDDKPIILVVMHHTFDPNMVIADSRRLVNKQNVHLTVDVLFDKDRFLPCQHNNAAWTEIETYLNISQVCSESSCLAHLRHWMKHHPRVQKWCTWILFGSVSVVPIVTAIIIICQYK